MKSGGKIFWGGLMAVIFCIVAGRNLAQSLPPIGHAQDFSTDVYYDPPNGEQIKARLSGAEALPLPGGLLDVKQFHMDTFRTNGTPQVSATAASCTFAPLDSVAYSPSHLLVVSGDGSVHVESDGFRIVWQTNAMSVTLSNNVHAVFESELIKK